MENIKVFTAAQVAEVLQVSLRTVQRITASGALPHRVIGERTVRYTEADVKTYLDGAQGQPATHRTVIVLEPVRRGGRKPARLVV